MGLFNLLLVGE